MTFIEILRASAIIAFGIFVGWVFYRMMKNADTDKEDEDNKE